MNKNFALFMALVAFIAVFAVVVMMHIPRKGIAFNDDRATDAGMPVVMTVQGSSELPHGRA